MPLLPPALCRALVAPEVPGRHPAPQHVELQRLLPPWHLPALGSSALSLLIPLAHPSPPGRVGVGQQKSGEQEIHPEIYLCLFGL